MFKRKIAAVSLALTLAVTSFTGCSIKTDTPLLGKIVGLKEDEIFKINDLVCKKSEYMLVLMNVANQYKSDFGGSIDWSSKVDDNTTLNNYIIEKVKEDISVKYALAAMAEEKNITLSDDEKTAITVAATEYFLTLTEEEKNYTGAETADVESIFTNYYLADKVYSELTKSIGDKTSDEEARVMKIQYIRMSTDKTKESVIKSTFENVTDLVKGGYQTFSREAKQYSEDSVIEKILKKNDVKAQHEVDAFNLNDGEIGNVVQEGNNYYLVYCVESYMKNETAKNKKSMIDSQKSDFFNKEYGSFLKDADTDYNSKVAEKITLATSDNVNNIELMNKFESIGVDSEDESK